MDVPKLGLGTRNQLISPLSILFTPFGILEIFSYGLAISRSGMIIYDYFIKKISWRQFLKPTIIEIIIVISLLIIGAFIEWNMIKDFTETPITNQTYFEQ